MFHMVARAYHGVELVNHKVSNIMAIFNLPLVHCLSFTQLYLVGGYDNIGPTYHSSVWCLNLDTMEWIEYSSKMEAKRCYISTCFWRDQIIAIGGHDGRERHRSVEAYDPHKNIWQPMASLCVARSDAAAVNYDDRMFIFGGFNGEVRHSCVVLEKGIFLLFSKVL